MSMNGNRTSKKLRNTKHGGLGLSEPAKCWLFWSRTNLPDRTIADLRLKVDGDLTRWRHMIGLQLKTTKN